MALQTPPPPSISPRQMNLLRIITAMAWSDGELSSEEVDLMLDRFSGMFAADAPQQQQLREELRDYMMQDIPLEELTPKIQRTEDRELVLKLGYEVIQASARTPEEPNINMDEAAAYQKLVQLLELPPETVKRIESEVESGGDQPNGLVDLLSRQLEEYMQAD